MQRWPSLCNLGETNTSPCQEKAKEHAKKSEILVGFFGGVLWKKRNIPSVMKLIFDWNRIWRAAEMGFSACLWELVSACLAKNWHWARIIEHSSCPFMMQKFLTFFPPVVGYYTRVKFSAKRHHHVRAKSARMICHFKSIWLEGNLQHCTGLWDVRK